MAKDFLSDVNFQGTVTLTDTDAGSSAAPIIELYRNSSSPADADYIGQLKFQGENDNDQKVVYAKITAKIGDATDTTEDGIIEITHQKAGSNNISARWTSDALKLINGTGLEIADGLLTLGSTAVTATAAELNLVDGITAGTVSASKAVIVDSNKDITGFRNVTLTGELDAATLDISGDADIDGTLEADAITVNGTALDEFIADTIGAMVTSNTETGVAVTYEDSDNTLDFVIGTLNQDTTGNAATATALETARTINGTSFDGSANITVTAAAGTVTGATLNSGVTASSLTSVGTLTGLSVTGAVTVGVDDTGHDVKFFGATSGKYMLWDESADSLIVKDTVDAVNFKVNGGQGSDGQVLTSTGSGVAWEDAAGGSPGGSNTQIQYNNSGSFGGSSNLTFDGSTVSVSSGTENIGLKITSTDEYALVSFADDGATAHGYAAIGGQDDGLAFFAGGNQRVTVLSGGNVGIGDTTAMRALDVVADIMIHHADDDHAWLWSVDTSGNNEMWYQSTYSGGDSGWSQKLNMDTSGNLTVYGDIVPDSNDTHDLGADGTEWNNLWIDVVKCTNEIQLADGSSSDPSLTFTSDGNTGIYRKASDQLAITCGSAIHYFGTDGLHLGSGDWFRSYGSTGWYNATYGTGLYSEDTTWVKTYDSDTGLLSLGGMAAALSGISSTSGYQYVMRGTVYTNFAYYTSMRDSKEQITNFTDSGVIVDALNPVTFVEAAPESETDAEKAWREADLQYGFVAEEICENDVTSHLGQYDGEMNAVGWKWQDTIAVLTAEVKSLRARVAVLEG